VKNIKKQVILLITTFVFILALFGTVSAANTTTGGDSGGTINSTDLSSSYQNSSLKEVKIKGQVLDCVTSKPFPGVNVTVSGNGNKLSSTKTNSKGEYELRFLSNLTQFNVTASYTGHKSSSQIVNTRQYTSNNSTVLQGTATFKLGKPKVVFLFTSSSAVSNTLMNALDQNTHFTSEVYLLKNLPAGLNLTKYDLVFIDYLYTSTPNLDKITPLIEEAKAKDIHVIITTTYYMSNPTNVDLTKLSAIRQYWTNISPENVKNMLKYMAVNFLGVKDSYQSPATVVKVGIYHPDADKVFSNLTSYLAWYKKYNSNKPTVAVMFGQFSYNKADTAAVDALISGFEAKGYNVIPYFLDHETYPLGQVDINTFLVYKGKFLPDLVVHYRAAGWDMIRSYNDTMAELISMNVPIIKALTYEDSYEKWLNATQGIGSATFAYSVTNGEKQGIIDPIVVATTETDSKGIAQTVPITRQINWIIDRSIAQINLKYKSNDNKKIAIIYWTSQPGLSSGVSAGHLDAYASLVNLLQALKDSGYNLGNKKIPTADELAVIIRNQGSNIGNWAPGDLKKLVENYPVVLIPESQYLAWFNKLNAAKRQEVIDEWGEAPGNIMVYTKNGTRYLVLPVIQYGNIILAPEPSRGYTQNGEVMYHSGSVPPTHQYLAFYFWLNNVYNADALINFGRHGTVAWLPGKSATGLDCENDWPAIVSQDMPVIYLFTVEGSESTLPQRRQGAVMISHLVPTMTISGLYGNLTVLNQKLNTYFDQSTSASIKAELKSTILQLTKTLHLDEDMNVNLSTIKDFDDFAIELQDYLQEMESEYITLGLHVLGEPPTGNYSIYMVQSLLGYQFRDYMNVNKLTDDQVYLLLEKVLFDKMSAEDAQKSVLNQTKTDLTAYLNLAIIYMNNLALATNEINSTLKALNGGYIPASNIGDPITNPNVLPTGNNMYSFDPRTVPTKEAWNIAVKLVDEMLSSYYKQHGKYPEKVAFMLWATHSIQDKGVMEAEILYLMGLKPKWDINGYVNGTEVIPNLGRPIIDVVITTTSLYLNDYKCVLDVLDDAVRYAATINSTTNYVKTHSNSIYQMLIKKGYNEEDAKQLSMSRIFSQEPGNHHNPLTEVTLGKSGDNMQAVIDTYINTFGYLYGSNATSQILVDLYTAILNGTSMAVFSRDVNANDLLGDDDYYAYFGGLGAAITKITGTEPVMVINNLENPDKPKTETLAESIARDLRTTYFNPSWISALISQGPGAASRLLDITNLLAWDILNPGTATSNQFQSIYDIYVRDSLNLGLNDYFRTNNPYAQQAIMYNLMQAIHLNRWNADSDALRALANSLATSINDNGWSGDLLDMNIVNEMFQNMNSTLVDGIKSKLYASTLNPAFAPSNPSQPQQGGSTSTGGTSSPGQVSSGVTYASAASSTQSSQESQSSAGNQGQNGNGQKAYEITKPENSSGSSEDTVLAAILGVILILGLMGAGYFRKDMLNLFKRK